MNLRWSDYILARDDEAQEAWAEAANGCRTLYIMGEGFDPRALTGLERLLNADIAHDLTVMSLPLSAAGPPRSERAQLAADNKSRLDRLVADAGPQYISLTYPDHVERRRSLGRLLFQQLLRQDEFVQADHIIIDISALPTGLYFALIAGVLDREQSGDFHGELQVVVAENPELDSLIEGEGSESAEPIPRFTFEIELDPQTPRPLIVWAPVLGERAQPQLEALQQNLLPDEICPVLPFPASNPRRADNLLVELRELLQDTVQVEPANFIYADESNPFDLYRALAELQRRYRGALKPLGEASVVISMHSSKTLSLGALLAAYEHELPVMNAEPEHYNFALDRVDETVLSATRLVCLWLTGTPTTLATA